MNKEQQLIKNNIATSIESIKKQIQASRRDLITPVEAYEYSRGTVNAVNLFLTVSDYLELSSIIEGFYIYDDYDDIDKLDRFINRDFKLDYSMFE